MSKKQRRLISFAGNTIAVEYSGSRLAAVVDFLYRNVPAGSDSPPCMTYRAIPSNQPKRMALYRDNTMIYEGDSEGTLAELLLGDTCYHLAARSRAGLLFHAAGLTWRGKGLLLPGAIGAGKTTLAAWLVTKGFDYLTDELVFVPYGASVMQTFTRPLNLKKNARPALQGYFDFEKHAAHFLSAPHTDLIPSTLLKSTKKLPPMSEGLPHSVLRMTEPPLNLIIFPRYLPGSDFALRPLSKAQAGLTLMQCLVNARNLVGYGFAEIVRLAKTALAYTMSYASFDQIGEGIETLLSAKNDCSATRQHLRCPREL